MRSAPGGGLREGRKVLTIVSCGGESVSVCDASVLGGGEPPEPASRSTNIAGVRALMLAVFEDGLRSFFSRSKLLAAEAEHWVFSPSRQSPFSFLVLCDVLGLDPDALRRKLAMLRSHGVSARDLIPRVRKNVRSVTRVRLRRRRRRRSSGQSPRSRFS